MAMKDKPADLLAEYFSGAAVAYHSVMLQMPAHRRYAEEYFKIRESFGLRGYPTKQEALTAINEATA